MSHPLVSDARDAPPWVGGLVPRRASAAVAAALLGVAVGAPTAVAAASFDGRYVGVITCSPIPNSTLRALRMEAVIVVTGTRAELSRDVLSLEGSKVVAKETAHGTVSANGRVELEGGASGAGWHFASRFAGTLAGARIELTGTESIPRPGGRTFERDCNVFATRE